MPSTITVSRRLAVAFAVLISAAALAAGEATVRSLPMTLKILNYDPALNAVLLSGEYQNPLAKPLLAWRGELKLGSGDATISLFLEQQARRPVRAGEWGVWSRWIDIKPDVPEHQTLKALNLDATEYELRLIRVLYADQTQEAF